MKLNPVVPGLYVRGRSDHMPEDEKASALDTAGVTRIINLWSRADADLADLYGRDYFHYAIPDGALNPAKAQVLEVLARGAATIIRTGGAVLVQCHAGRNRSGLMATMIVRYLTGKSGPDALAMVREARPTAVANPAFEAYLGGLEALE